MNNYINYPKTFNYLKQMMPNNINKPTLYEPYDGFIRGNLFQNLYDPYKIEKPYEIRPMNEQADLLTKIDALCFACIDLSLYLDVYPNDQEAINLYNQYREQENIIMKEYQGKFGPLLLSSESLNTYPWAWDNKPWPWEN